ncbi:MAG: hypothetical protein ACI89J_004703, partial [Hyphomicrobiaceae bacterium]
LPATSPPSDRGGDRIGLGVGDKPAASAFCRSAITPMKQMEARSNFPKAFRVINIHLEANVQRSCVDLQEQYHPRAQYLQCRHELATNG